MKVYVLIECCNNDFVYEDTTVIGVFDAKEKAVDVIRDIYQRDLENYGEKICEYKELLDENRVQWIFKTPCRHSGFYYEHYTYEIQETELNEWVVFER